MTSDFEGKATTADTNCDDSTSLDSAKLAELAGRLAVAVAAMNPADRDWLRETLAIYAKPDSGGGPPADVPERLEQLLAMLGESAQQDRDPTA